ncbi:hypothetical protein [Streptomyces cinereoruber]|uniref:hypothetical protein n=1 Tax=Streptomyces cinereoruber TaxID=67260 RepID=UPI00362B0E5D
MSDGDGGRPPAEKRGEPDEQRRRVDALEATGPSRPPRHHLLRSSGSALLVLLAAPPVGRSFRTSGGRP